MAARSPASTCPSFPASIPFTSSTNPGHSVGKSHSMTLLSASPICSLTLGLDGSAASVAYRGRRFALTLCRSEARMATNVEAFWAAATDAGEAKGEGSRGARQLERMRFLK